LLRYGSSLCQTLLAYIYLMWLICSGMNERLPCRMPASPRRWCMSHL
jgi:hypothetical protein